MNKKHHLHFNNEHPEKKLVFILFTMVHAQNTGKKEKGVDGRELWTGLGMMGASGCSQQTISVAS